MTSRRTLVRSAAVAALAIAAQTVPAAQAAADSGVVQLRSAYSMSETIARLKTDIAAKGIVLFSEIDQAALAAKAGVGLRPSTLLVFGNPGLGSHFITANPAAGLDWPVRLLIFENDKGEVWMAYTDFAWIARRHAIASREKEFKMATEVVTSITGTAMRRQGASAG